MANAVITQATVLEDSGVVLLARVRGADGSYITQASLTSINVYSYDLNGDTSTPVYSDESVTISAVVFDALQTSDARWTVDTTGYNVAYTMSATALPLRSTYQVEMVFDPVSGDDFTIAYQIETLERYSG